MKNRVNKLISITLVIIMLFSVLSVNSGAVFTVTDKQWSEYWDTKDRASVHISPGSDESEMNFAWFGIDKKAVPCVYIKKIGSTDYAQFTGTTKVSDNVIGAVYNVTATGLLPETSYQYYCVSGKFTSNVFAFKTGSVDEFTAVLVSDIHISKSDEDAFNIRNSAGLFNNILTEAVSREPSISLILSAGDNADHGLYEEYEGFFAPSLVKSIPVATVCGNHDYKAEVYPDVMNYSNIYNNSDKNGGDYWFTKGDTLFLMLNGNWISSGDHRRFVKMAVDANPDCKWRVAVMHHDLYGGHIAHRESENKLLRTMFAPIFDEFNVDLVLMGHSHIYSRSHVLYDNNIVENLDGKNSVKNADGTIYITTGSTSRPRADAEQGSDRVAFDYRNGTDYIYDTIKFTEDSIEFKAYVAQKDAPMDSFTIYKTETSGIDDVSSFYDIIHIISFIASFFRNIGQILGID